MNIEKLNEFEELLFNMPDKIIIDENGKQQSVKSFDVNIVRRFKDNDIIFKFNNLHETIEIVTFFIEQNLKEETTQRLIKEAKEHHVQPSGSILVKIS